MLSNSRPRTLAESLRTWDEEALTELLRARPDLGRPPPRDLAALAARSTGGSSIGWALDQLEDPKDSYRVQLGMTVLTSLGADPLINKTDNKLLDKVNKIVAARSARQGSGQGRAPSFRLYPGQYRRGGAEGWNCRR